MAKDTILYFEDEPGICEEAEFELNDEFPNLRTITCFGGVGCVENVLKQAGGIERIAIVSTDGNLKELVQGWEVVEELRAKGYTGPAVYTGASNLPKDKEHLYAAQTFTKHGDDFLDAIREHI